MEFTSIAVLTAGVAVAWQYARSFIGHVRSLLITRVTLHGEIGHAVVNYIMHEGRVFSLGDKLIRSGPEWVRPLDSVAVVGWFAAPTQSVFALVPGSNWALKRLVTFCSPKQGEHSQSNLPESDVVVLTFVRHSVDIVELTRAALEYSRNKKKCGHRYAVRRIGTAQRQSSGRWLDDPVAVKRIDEGHRKFIHWLSDEVGAHTVARPFESYILDDISKWARTDFQRWMSLRVWYRERGIPWRRGHLYYGPPGTGKTSLARAIAQEADIPVFSFDLSSLDNNTLCREWQSMQGNTPCMALIEDIDGCFDGRKNVLAEMGGGLTFDCLLNCIGGIESCDGVFVVITTNKPESLDEAIGRPTDGTETDSSRPGRVDRAYRLGTPSRFQASDIVKRILGDCTDEDLQECEGRSAAQITEHAINKAMNQMFV